MSDSCLGDNDVQKIEKHLPEKLQTGSETWTLGLGKLPVIFSFFCRKAYAPSDSDSGSGTVYRGAL